MARETKTKAQRAQEALETSGRKLQRLHDRKDELNQALANVLADIESQEKEHAYLSSNPHLSPVQQPLDLPKAESAKITEALLGSRSTQKGLFEETQA